MAYNLRNLPYQIGKPGMKASHSYAHNRQHISDSFWTNQQAYNFEFGTAAIVKAGKLDRAAATGGKFLGVFQDNEKYIDNTSYPPKSMVTVATMGDWFVKVPLNLVIVPMDDVTYLETTADAGSFSNAAAAANIIAVPRAKFLTPNLGGYAAIGLDTW